MDCQGISETDLGEWGAVLLNQLGGRRYPLGGAIELTERCNLRCVHCYINQPASNKAARQKELSLDQITGILDQLVEAGTLFLLFTGGEILLRPDFSQIYQTARHRGFLISLFTNGTLLTPDLADLLAESRPQGIEITMYGATKETYERVTQAPGSYDRFRRGIDLLLERNLPLSLKSVLLTLNFKELLEMKALANQLGVKFRYDGTIWPRLDGGQGPIDYSLSIPELLRLDREDPERWQEWQVTAEQFRGQLVRSKYIYNCGAGLHSFHIDSRGQMCICMMARHPSYDLLKINFQQVWEKFGTIREQKRQLATRCQNCEIGGLCVQCPGWSQAIHGDDETPVDFICQLGRERHILIKNTSHI